MLPTYEKNGFVLYNGYETHLENPETFWIPDENIRKNIQPGWCVKLIFNIEIFDPETNKYTYEVERMWVKVEGREGDCYFRRLDNQPFFTDAIKPGLKIYFTQEHIINFLDENDLEMLQSGNSN